MPDSSSTLSATDDETTFPVSKEELSIIKADLALAFPEDYSYLSNDYILSVASKPYSKDPTVRRPIEYSTTKLSDLLQWRADNAVKLSDLIQSISSSNASTSNASTSNASPSVSPPVSTSTNNAQAIALATSLNYGSMYWHGLDKAGRPILWIRTNRMPWFPDIEAQVNTLILLADAGIQAMPEGVTEFVVLSDSRSPPPPNPQFMMNLLSALVKGYPDRLNLLVSCPVGTIIQTVMKLLLPLMPSRLSSKIVLIGEEEGKEKLGKILLGGETDVPSFMPNGTNDHDELYPEGGKFQGDAGQILKFDWDGMIDRLKDDVKQFQEDQEQVKEQE